MDASEFVVKNTSSNKRVGVVSVCRGEPGKEISHKRGDLEGRWRTKGNLSCCGIANYNLNCAVNTRFLFVENASSGKGVDLSEHVFCNKVGVVIDLFSFDGIDIFHDRAVINNFLEISVF